MGPCFQAREIQSEQFDSLKWSSSGIINLMNHKLPNTKKFLTFLNKIKNSDRKSKNKNQKDNRISNLVAAKGNVRTINKAVTLHSVIMGENGKVAGVDGSLIGS
jgi:hypothetical protein